MRSLCAGLGVAILTAPLVVLCVGCGDAASSLEKPPEAPRQMDPMKDMPGFAEQQEKLKKEGKIK